MILDELQQSIYDRLSSEVSGMRGIYTNVPQDPESEDDAAFPYIAINPINTTPTDTKDDNGIVALIDVNVFTRSNSAKSDRALLTPIYDALQKYSDLPVTGANVIDCRYDGGTDFMESDGKTKQYSLTFRVVYYLT